MVWKDVNVLICDDTNQKHVSNNQDLTINKVLVQKYGF